MMRGFLFKDIFINKNTIMTKIIKLKESDLENIVKRVLQENEMNEKSSCYETMEGTCNTMYESALKEGKNCMEAYESMCSEMNTLMEDYRKKCQEAAVNEGFINEEDISEEDDIDAIEIGLDHIAMLLKDGECSCSGQKLVLDLEGGHEEEDEEYED